MPGIKRAVVGLALFLALSGCYSPPRLKDGLTPKSREIQEYIVQIKKKYNIKELNNKVRYVEFSKISKDSIIILNDLDGSFKWYEELARELNRNYAVYIFDKRGSGVNVHKKGSATDLVKDIDKLIDRIEKENPNTKINLFASCYGARRGLEFLIRKPEKLKSAILSSPALYMEEIIDLNCIEKLGIAFSFIYGGTTRKAIPNDNFYTDNNEKLKLIQEDLLRLKEVSNNDYFWGELQLWKVRENLKNLEKTKVPIKVFLGKKDRVIDTNKVKKKLRNIKNVEIEELPTSHLIYFDKENRDLFIEEIKDFIESH